MNKGLHAALVKLSSSCGSQFFNRDCDKFVPHGGGSGFSAIRQCRYCYVAMLLLPYGSVLTATWQCLYCHMAVPRMHARMPYGNALNVIWQHLDCHMAVPPLQSRDEYGLESESD